MIFSRISDETQYDWIYERFVCLGFDYHYDLLAGVKYQ